MSEIRMMVDLAEDGLVVFQEDGRRTKGEPPILVAENAHCDECGREHEFEKCPQCGSWIYCGFGLFGGGYGQYKVCDGDPPCDWMWKQFDDEGTEFGTRGGRAS